jgi:3-phenylpropionate/trans-cinnamate dioxygenase ferredoxin subunit
VNWIDAGPVAAIPDGGAISIAAGRRMIAIVKSAGECFALEDICTHDGAELTGGAVEGTEIVCPRHGARFCLRTGQALTPPAYEPVQVFETRVADGRLWVRSG